MNEVGLNKYGYYDLLSMPNAEELKRYYDDYYQQGKSKSYQQEYTQLELDFFNAKLQQKEVLCGNFKSFLDVGCGEGFALKYFHEKGYEVEGVDYSDAGMLKHNPDMTRFLKLGDVLNIERQFDIVNLDNILEHVLNPRSVLEQCFTLCKKKLIVKVPNDFSKFQEYALELGLQNSKYWVVVPDHLHYFNSQGLINVCEVVGFKKEKILGNYLTEFYALHKDTNYLENPDLGRECHFARCREEVLFNKISIQKTINLYEAYGNMGLGREIIGVFTK